jgi:iron(III) transport system ATP-binding protein
MTAALRFIDVEHAYGDKIALRGISFDVDEASIVCLLGPSGCGKTTALRIAAGLETPTRGIIRLAGRVVTGPDGVVPPERRDAGLLFQDYALFPHLTVEENIAFGLAGMSSAARSARVGELLRRVDMEARRTAYPHTLSGGEQQRIALARALAPRPAVLLLDEPFSGLDTVLRQQVRDETLHVLSDIGAAVLLVTHDPEEALFMADRIALMRDGAILQIGTPTDLYTRPADEFVAGFFGEVNRIASRAEGGTAPSPFGPLPTPGIADGMPVVFLIRSEAVKLRMEPRAGESRPDATVEAARMLGRSSLIHLRTDPATGFSLQLHARQPGVVLPARGAAVWIDVDPRLVFVFPQA